MAFEAEYGKSYFNLAGKLRQTKHEENIFTICVGKKEGYLMLGGAEQSQIDSPIIKEHFDVENH